MSKTSAQDRAVAYVRDNQGCHSMNVAMACDSNCTPESGYKATYGFKTVERALQNGKLFRIESCHHSGWQWFTNDVEGRKAAFDHIRSHSFEFRS